MAEINPIDFNDRTQLMQGLRLIRALEKLTDPSLRERAIAVVEGLVEEQAIKNTAEGCPWATRSAP